MKLILVFCFLVNFIQRCYSICSSHYGSEPCTYVPAPPGKTPTCARPGLTYCEHPDNYPGQLIHYLVQKWRFDHKTLLISESRDEFSSYYYPPPKPVYGPPNYHHIQLHNALPYDEGYNYPEPIYIPKPDRPFTDNSATYIPQKVYPIAQNFSGYPVLKPYSHEQKRGQVMNFKYTDSIGAGGQIYSQQYQPQNYYTSINPPDFANQLWKRRAQYTRLKRSARSRRAVNSNQSTNSTVTRPKRQSALNSETLCRTRSQYIVPRAALNNKGNWMYVVNMPDVDSSATQLVKTETCASQACSGICSLPQDYSSRCEQRYVQKRLVALEGSGSQLYTDVFWFPSCCICTISRQ